MGRRITSGRNCNIACLFNLNLGAVKIVIESLLSVHLGAYGGNCRMFRSECSATLKLFYDAHGSISLKLRCGKQCSLHGDRQVMIPWGMRRSFSPKGDYVQRSSLTSNICGSRMPSGCLVWHLRRFTSSGFLTLRFE